MHLVISVKYGEADNTLYKLIYIALKIVLLVACMHNTAGSSLLWQWSAGFINLFKLLRVRHENQLLNPNLFCTSSNISIIRPSLLKKNAAAYLTLLSTWILSLWVVCWLVYEHFWLCLPIVSIEMLDKTWAMFCNAFELKVGLGLHLSGSQHTRSNLK